MRLYASRLSLAGAGLAAVLALLFATSIAYASQTGAPSTGDGMVLQEEAEADIIDTAEAAGDFTTLLAAIDAAGLEETLRGDGPFTVFAPNDAAFDALPEGTLDSLLDDPETLESVLLYHVVEGEVLAADVVELESATTIQGADIQIAVSNGDVTLNQDVNVITTDIQATNGVIHVIDGVLLPPEVEPEPTPTPEPEPEPTPTPEPEPEDPIEPAPTGSGGMLGGSATGGGTYALVAGVLVALGALLGGALAIDRRRSN